MAPPSKIRKTKAVSSPKHGLHDYRNLECSAISRPLKRSTCCDPPDTESMSRDDVTRSCLETHVRDENMYSRSAIKRRRSSSPAMGSDYGFFMSQTHPPSTRHSSRSHSPTDSGYSSTSSVVSETSKPRVASKHSFLDLPAEIRNQIYRLAFVSEEKIDFAYPNNFCRSSALLQTCHQVHEEGRSILYSENTFYLQRRKKERASRWTTDVCEIGYEDIHFFLKTIGPANLSLLRKLVVMFEDAQPSMNTHLKDADERRFTNDHNLLDILRMLSTHTMLKTLDLCFQGRRTFYNRDETRFIERLTLIKADQVNCINNPDTPFSNWKGLSKICPADAGRLVHEMTRRVTIFR
jgi:hypothetical protein